MPTLTRRRAPPRIGSTAGAWARPIRAIACATAATGAFTGAANAAATLPAALASDGPLIILLLAAAASALVFIGFFFAATLRNAPRRGGDFGDLIRGANGVIALTDGDGRVREASAEARRRAGVDEDGEPDPRVLECLAGGSAFRLGVEARKNGHANARIPLPNGRCALVQVAATGDGGLLWTAGDEPAEAPREALLRRLPTAIFDRNGALRDENEAYAALPFGAKTAIRDEAFAARAAHRTTVDAASDASPFGALALRDHGEGEFAVHVAPRFETAMGSQDPLFERMPIAAAWLTDEGRLVALNGAARTLLGKGAAPGAALSDLIHGLGRPIEARIREAADGQGAGRPDLTRRIEKDENGRPRESFLQVSFTRVDGVRGASLLAIINDATELKVLEQQFVQSQKMQAVGQLAGGVAHDFNNLLTAILGHCDLMAMRLDESEPEFEELSQIRQNANRAAALVRQLLAFSRQQKLNPAQVSLGDVLSELSVLLNRLIGEKVTLEVAVEDGLWDVWLDAQQFEQVILNLVVNARDAMPGGGGVQIRCSNVVFTEELQRGRAVVPVGDYVQVEVQDEGVGMAEELQVKAFEPFFTTKRVGEGTGLGLSTVYGIVKQTGGFIFIHSTPGEGATFQLLFPRQAGHSAAAPRKATPALEDLSGSGRILLVEDEAPVRTFARRALTLRGYDVVEAPEAETALEIIMAPGEAFDLIVSDVVMPGRDGPSWVREARQAHPDVAVLFTSGYSEDVFRVGLEDLENCSFLPKPFTLESLAAAVKRCIAGDAEAAAGEAPEAEAASENGGAAKGGEPGGDGNKSSATV